MKNTLLIALLAGFIGLGTACQKPATASDSSEASKSVETSSNTDGAEDSEVKPSSADARPEPGTRISGKVARKLVATGAKIVDVRTPGEFADGHVEGALNIPVGDLAGRISELNPSEEIVVYCRSGARSSRAMAMLRDQGYQQVWDMGPYSAW